MIEPIAFLSAPSVILVPIFNNLVGNLWDLLVTVVWLTAAATALIVMIDG